MNKTISLGAVIMALAVILGAFGAHALKDTFTEKSLNWWNTAQYYHAIHGLGLLAVGLLSYRLDDKLLRWAALGFIIGLVLFSGSLYTMALWPDLRWLGAVTPIGGIAFIIGWVMIMLAARKMNNKF